MNREGDYRSRINSVINYVAENLEKPHTIDQLAEIAHFSKFHFHRLFSALTGETVQAMVSRMRLESAAATLIYHKSRPITQIAVDHGFSSGANFTKAFTKHFGSSPSVFRSEQARPFNNSKIGKDMTSVLRDYKQTEHEVSISHQVQIKLAYLRCKGKYLHKRISAMHRDVWHWAEEQDCIAEEPISVGITWSDSHIVEEKNWVYDACVAVQPGTKGDDAIGIQTLQEGPVAQLKVEMGIGDSHDLSAYWNWLLGSWYVASGYELRLSPSYELYCESEKGLVVQLCLPIESK